MSEHTPIPWHVDKDLHRFIYDAEGKGIGEAWHLLQEYEEAVANAEFIVRACNSHDDLLAALKAAADAFNDISRSVDVQHPADTSAHANEAEAAVRAAIAKAELPA